MKKLLITTIVSLTLILVMGGTGNAGIKLTPELEIGWIGSDYSQMDWSLRYKGIISLQLSEKVPVTFRGWITYEPDHVLSEQGQNGYGEGQHHYDPLGFGLGLGLPINRWLLVTIDIGYCIPLTENKYAHGDGDMLFWSYTLAKWNYPFGVELLDGYKQNVAESFMAEVALKGQYQFEILGAKCRVSAQVGYVFRNPNLMKEALINNELFRERFPNYPLSNGENMMQWRETRNLGGPTAAVSIAIPVPWFD